MQYVPLYLQETLPSIKSPALNNKTPTPWSGISIYEINILVQFARTTCWSILMMKSRQEFKTLYSTPIILESENFRSVNHRYHTKTTWSRTPTWLQHKVAIAKNDRHGGNTWRIDWWYIVRLGLIKTKIEAHQGSLVFLRVLFHRSFQFGHPPPGRGRHISP